MRSASGISTAGIAAPPASAASACRSYRASAFPASSATAEGGRGSTAYERKPPGLNLEPSPPLRPTSTDTTLGSRLSCFSLLAAPPRPPPRPRAAPPQPAASGVPNPNPNPNPDPNPNRDLPRVACLEPARDIRVSQGRCDNALLLCATRVARQVEGPPQDGAAAHQTIEPRRRRVLEVGRRQAAVEGDPQAWEHLGEPQHEIRPEWRDLRTEA